VGQVAVTTPVFDDYFSIQSRASGISWSAAIAGAFVASALHLTLLELGSGMSLSWIGP